MQIIMPMHKHIDKHNMHNRHHNASNTYEFTQSCQKPYEFISFAMSSSAGVIIDKLSIVSIIIGHVRKHNNTHKLHNKHYNNRAYA